MKQILLLLLLFFALILNAFPQQADTLRLKGLKEELSRAMESDTAFAGKIDITVSQIPLDELLRSIAKAGNINLNINMPDKKSITCNFKQIRITDFIFFVCKEYGLNAEWIENILLLYPYVPRLKSVLQTDYDWSRQVISFDYLNARLVDVTKNITEECGVNVIVPQDLFDFQVSAYGKEMGINEAIRTIASVNSLISRKKDENTWLVYRVGNDEQHSTTSINQFDINELNVDSLGLITANITNGNIEDIISEVSGKLGVNHFFSDHLDHQTAIFVEKVDLDTFLKVLFTGTSFSWRVDNGVYIFGQFDEGNKLSVLKVIPMKYRTVDKVQDIIPEHLKPGLDIITFPDLNSLILYGDQRTVLQVTRFLTDIDKSVPLVSIDVIIVDATDTDMMESGISMGVGTEPGTSTGALSPGVDFSLNGSSVNKLINTFNGFGSINLGKVSPNFYMDLKFLEEKGKIIVRSTPRLSALNGHKASLKSGEKKYYKESQVNIIGTQNPLQSESYLWKDVEANFTLDILPYVSLDSCITLQMDINQSEFTEREGEDENAPPGTLTRGFRSVIKVKNQEMVLLGGIEKNTLSSTSRGLPFIARIPVLKWLFGSSVKNNTSQKLNIFVKPTII